MTCTGCSLLCLTLLYLAILYLTSQQLNTESSTPTPTPEPRFTPKPNVDCTSSPQSGYPFCDKSVDPMKRAEDLVSRLTLDEVIQQTSTIAPGIPRLGLKDYNWRSNCLHGWSLSGGKWDEDMKWTVFPAPIGLGATFDMDLIERVGQVTSTEGRALHNEMLVKFNGSSTEAAGLNCFSPNVNLFRDPRWGRGQETFGEDPYLISVIGNAYTRGLQEGEDKQYLKVAACPKHYAVHSGPEQGRQGFAANVSLYDLYDTYLPAFKSQVIGARAAQIMPALSGVNCSRQNDSAPDAANPFLLETVLREEFAATNISICSDSGCVANAYTQHHYTDSYEMAAAVCMNATTDLDLGHDQIYPQYLPSAVKDGFMEEKTIQQSAIRNFYLRMLVGDFDPPSSVPYQSIDKSSLDTDDNKKLNLEAARKSIVLLKNYKKTLPLAGDSIKHILVTGPNANNSGAMLSNYEGVPSSVVTVLEGIQQEVPSTVVVDTAKGCTDYTCSKSSSFKAVVDKAKDVEYVIMVMGLFDFLEREGQDRRQTSCDGTDVPLLGLPGCQSNLVEAVTEVNSHVIVVLLNGGALSIQNLLDNDKVLGVLEAFYPGAVGGTAVADVLFGRYNPAGRMPVTVYSSTSELPPIENYDMSMDPGRTHRYYKNKPLIPFGFGLSYSEHVYSDLKLSTSKVSPCDSVKANITVEDVTHNMHGEEVVLAYLHPQPILARSFFPRVQLVGFKRISLTPGVKQTVTFNINPYLMSLVHSDGTHGIFPGSYTVEIGGEMAEFKITGSSLVATESCTNAPKCLACDST